MPNWPLMHYDTDLSQADTAIDRASRDGARLKVFLIEDSALLQELLGSMLGELDGVEFCGCAVGETEALRRMAETPFDLVIIDIELKQGSGIGVLDALQTDSALYGQPCKVVLSNYAHATMRRRCEHFGMDAFFDKSLHLNELIDYVIDAARRKAAS